MTSPSKDRQSLRRGLVRWSWLLFGALIELVLLLIVQLGDLRGRAGPFIALALTAAACYWSAIALISRAGPAIDRGRLSRWVVGLGLLFRATLLLSPPSLSDDVYRYLWDGHVLTHGLNPYTHPPSAPELAHLRTPYHAAINYREIPTIYPPLTELAFGLGAAADLGLLGPKLVFWAFELALFWTVSRLLLALGLGPERLLIYAWNPLILFEFSGSAHADTLALWLLVCSSLAIIQKRPGLSTMLLALATVAKLVPAIMLAAHRRWIRPRHLAVFGALIVLAYVPFLGAGWNLTAAVREYARRWRFNDGIFTVAYELCRSAGLEDASALLTAKLALAAVFLATVAWVTVHQIPPLRAGYLLLGTYLLLSPVLHPWYLAWMVPYLAVYPNRAWLLLTGLVVISYAVLIGAGPDSNQWVEPWWTRPAQYLPFFALLAWDGLRPRASQELSP